MFSLPNLKYEKDQRSVAPRLPFLNLSTAVGRGVFQTEISNERWSGIGVDRRRIDREKVIEEN